MRSYIWLLLFSIIISLQARAQQADNVDSLKKALNTAKEDTLKIAILSDIGFAYVTVSPDTAMLYWQQQMRLAQRVNLPRFTANAYNDLAIIQYYKGNFTDALSNNKKALEIREQLGDPALILSSLNKIGVIYQEIGDYDKAVNVQMRVLKIAGQLHNEAYVGITLQNIGGFYMKVKKYDEAMGYFRKAVAIAARLKDTLQLANTYATMETVFEDEGKLDSAYFYQLTTIDLYKLIDAQTGLAQAYNSMGHLCRVQRKNADGIYYYKKALELARIMDNTSDRAMFAANVGNVHMEEKQADSGFLYIKEAIKFNSPAVNAVSRTIYAALAIYYTLKTNTDSAIYYNDLYRDMIDTIYSASLATQLNELLTKYETEKKEQQITILNEQNTVKQLNINRKNMTIAGITGAFIAAILFGALFYNRYRLKQETRLQEEIIRQQHLASKAVIAAEELERQRIANDLHDGIGQMFSAVKMNLSGLAHRIDIQQEDEKLLMDKTIALVDESCREVRVISHQMMPNVLLKSGLTTAIRDFIDKIDESKIKISLETFGLQQPLESNVETVLYRVIQESVNNVIKHANASMLDIQLHKDEESTTVTIEDNGKGFDIASLPANKGIGLKNIQARVAFLNGKVEYDSAPGRGTLIAIYIPHNS